MTTIFKLKLLDQSSVMSDFFPLLSSEKHSADEHRFALIHKVSNVTSDFIQHSFPSIDGKNGRHI